MISHCVLLLVHPYSRHRHFQNATEFHDIINVYFYALNLFFCLTLIYIFRYDFGGMALQ